MTEKKPSDTTMDAASVHQMPAVWLVRAGRNGEDEAVALEQGVAIIGWRELSDLSDARTRDMVASRLENEKPDSPKGYITNVSSQLYAFSCLIRQGDIIALPLKTQPGLVALGWVKGSYTYRDIENEGRHIVPVDWARPDVPRAEFGQDLLYSIGAFLTVCRIRRNDAERRIAAIIGGQTDPGISSASSGGPGTDGDDASDEKATLDYADIAHQRILDHVRVRFTGHDLSRLVGVVLEADGYKTMVSPPGPDGGIDILASKGSLGFETPRLCVQVKATNSPADVNVYRALTGTMQSFGAKHGLLVSWNGFTSQATREARQNYFAVRLWTATDLLDEIYRTYDRLPTEIRREIPLQRMWVLTLDGPNGL